jgi:LysR family glycine cleavage system transcriptional activator
LIGPDDDVDLAIRYGPAAWPGVQARRLCTERLSVVCAPAYRDAQGIDVPADLRGDMMIRNPWQPWTPWLRAANLTNLEPSGRVYLDSGLVLQATVLGYGVALGRSLLMHYALAEGRLIRLFELEVEDVYGRYVVNLRPSNADTQIFESWSAYRYASRKREPREEVGCEDKHRSDYGARDPTRVRIFCAWPVNQKEALGGAPKILAF